MNKRYLYRQSMTLLNYEKYRNCYANLYIFCYYFYSLRVNQLRRLQQMLFMINSTPLMVVMVSILREYNCFEAHWCVHGLNTPCLRAA